MTKTAVLRAIRILAKHYKYQSVYNLEKMQFKIFQNERDLSEIQLAFLDYLAFYNNIYTDISLGEIDSKVIENDIYEDAYVYWRRHKPEEKPKQRAPEHPVTSKWVFKKRK